MKIIEMLLGDIEKDGVFAISLVDKPAINEDWVALSEEPILLKSLDLEKRIILGAVLVPDRKILRKDKDGSPYYIYFTADTIEKTAQDFAKKKNLSNITKDHNSNVDGVTIVETWIKTDDKLDKSNSFGMDLPIGTWFVSMKVDSDEIWNDYIKTGVVKGFSIEGRFSDIEKKELSAIEDEDDIILKIKEIISRNES